MVDTLALDGSGLATGFLHIDPTTVEFAGQYQVGTGRIMRGKKAPDPGYGYPDRGPYRLMTHLQLGTTLSASSAGS